MPEGGTTRVPEGPPVYQREGSPMYQKEGPLVYQREGPLGGATCVPGTVLTSTHLLPKSPIVSVSDKRLLSPVLQNGLRYQ